MRMILRRLSSEKKSSIFTSSFFSDYDHPCDQVNKSWIITDRIPDWLIFIKDAIARALQPCESHLHVVQSCMDFGDLLAPEVCCLSWPGGIASTGSRLLQR